MSDTPGVTPGRIDEAIYFPSGEHQLFAWLHRPEGKPEGNIGLVICKPFGYESLCGHRSLRAFGTAIAALGVPALRFDYVGTGDSADIDPEADQIDAWLQDIKAAIAELRRRTGVQQVVLLGFRLGAVLATLAATRCPEVSALALVAPVMTGRRYLRELRTTRLAALMGIDTQGSGDPQADAAPTTEGSREFSGYTMSAPTMVSLANIDLTKLQMPPVAEALIIDRSDLPTAKRWTEALADSGVQTAYHAVPGFVEMMMVAPAGAIIPQAMIESTCQWLQRIANLASTPPLHSTEVHALGVSVVSAEAQLVLPGEGPATNDEALTERPVLLPPDAISFGIVTEPRRGEPRRRAVILLNTGADSHIGASRMNVTLARRWANRGYVVLRIDLAGLGDAAARPGRPDNEVFPPAAFGDIRAAVEWLRSQYGVGDITLAGLCSGAYHALRAASGGLPINRILLVNPQTFFWRDGQTINDVQMVEIAGSPGVHRERARSAKNWIRLLTGQVDVRRIAKVNIQRVLLAAESAGRDWARRLRIRLPRDLYWDLDGIAARGVRIVFVFAHGEPGLEVFKMLLGPSLNRLGNRCRIHMVDSADHTFSQGASREVMMRILSDELSAPPRGELVSATLIEQNQ